MSTISLVRRVMASVVVLFVGCLSSLSAAENQALQVALQSITAGELGHHVDVLAADSFEGREAGSRGGRAAGGYLVQLLQEYGVRPAGTEGTYYQLFGQGYRNVLGMIEGSDPQRKQEVIILGAHYDHVGYGTNQNSFGPTGHIHNGADDNASGTSGLLEVVEAFTKLSQPPRRSILFAFWDGEEKGMLGSQHWVSNPTVPLNRVVFSFNADMIGHLRDQHVEVYGSRTAAGLRQLVSQQNLAFGLDLDFIWDVKPNSDHYSFFEHDIPFLMLHTGLHDYYHRPSDDTELINREGMQTVSQLMFRLAYELSARNQVPAFRTQSRFETNYARAQFERTMSPAPPRLGVSWSREDHEAGLLVTRVADDSAADRAGIKVGDRIVRFDGRAVEGSEQFRLAVLAAGSAAAAIVQRPGNPEPMEVLVPLAGKPVRIGISWDHDKADPSLVLVTRVIPGSAADLAGISAQDRVYAVDGQPFADAHQFSQLLSRRGASLQLLVERHGLLRSITLHPLEEKNHVADAVDDRAGSTAVTDPAAQAAAH